MTLKLAFSYSRLKNFTSCPKRHWAYDLAPWDERIRDEESDALREGNEAHTALANALSKGTPLPPLMQEWNYYLDKLAQVPGKLFVEQNLAFNRDFQACMYKSPNVFWRTKIDLIKIYKEKLALVWDWKTGKRKVEEDQLFLSAQAVFAHHPEVTRVLASFVWLSDPPKEAFTTMEYTRKDMAPGWAELMPRVKAMEKAYVKEDFPPTPSGLCVKHCGVTSCIYHGKGSR